LLDVGDHVPAAGHDVADEHEDEEEHEEVQRGQDRLEVVLVPEAKDALDTPYRTPC
jgi:hypothetical protein